MADLPPGFLPDLRALRSWPDLHGSLWREPYLVEHTHGDIYRVVRGRLDPPADVLDLGCGLGHIALELARDGCRVVGVDADAESIALARAARDADPLLRDRGVLTYEVADVGEWWAPPERFDAVVASRVLHHVADPEQLLAGVAAWLRPGGRLVAVELAYDRFDRRGASWLYETRGLLQASGAHAGDRLGVDVRAGIDRVWDAWWRHHEEEHRLNTFGQLVGALRGAFRERRRGWLPYLYWDVLEELDVPPAAGEAVARFLRNLEQHLVTEGALPAVLFEWVGERASRRPRVPGAAVTTP
jgi:SAM-dependent methyltransferase